MASGDPVERVRQLKREAGQDIWLCGGGQLAASLAGEIDALILKVNPILLGGGIPLVASRIEPRRLRLVESRLFSNGVALMHYR